LWIFGLFPAVASIAILISTLLGSSLRQFELAGAFAESAWLLIPFAVFTLFFGPVPEEIGWRGYGLDALCGKYGYLTASVILGVAWGVWHIPLFFIEGYPLRGHIGEPLKLIVFFADLIPKSLIFTYVFFSNNRSILSAILLHFMVNFVGQIIEIDTVTEFIQMLLLFGVATYILVIWKRAPVL
jgi:membrane protease YdiL (CAAX protease family)